MNFKEVIGHEILKTQIISNINQGRINHAQLFLGPEGCGSLALAIAYGRYLSCNNRQPEDACGICPSCRKYNKLSHPDLTFIYPVPARSEGGKALISKDFASQWRSFLSTSVYVGLNDWYTHLNIDNKQGIIGAEDCNEIVRVLSYKPFEGEYKIVIIWMIERLYYSAAPKLLKILEEPPNQSIFLIISENHDQILSTILSRLQIIKVPPLTDEEIASALTEKYNYDEQQATQIALISDGNIVKALSLMKNPEIFQSNLILFRDWLRTCFAFNIQPILSLVDQFAAMGREKQKTLLLFGIELMRKCIFAGYQISELVRADNEITEFVDKLKNVVSPQIATLLVEELTLAIQAIERNANPKILFTDLSFKTALLLRTKK